MEVRAAEHVAIEWIHADLPLTPNYQVYFTHKLPDLAEKLPNVKFINPAWLRVIMGRFVRQNGDKLTSMQDILEQEVAALCDMEVVLEEPRVTVGHSSKLSIDLTVTGSRDFLRQGKRVRNRLIKASGGPYYQAMGDRAGLRCILATTPKDVTSSREMEQALVVVESALSESFPWTFTPNRIQLFSRESSAGRVFSAPLEITPGFVQVAA